MLNWLQHSSTNHNISWAIWITKPAELYIGGLAEDYSNSIIHTFRLWQNGHHFPDDIFKCIFLNKNVLILFKISLKFVPKGPINNIPALVQIMAWRQSGDKPLSEPMMVIYWRIYVSLNELMQSG